MAEQHQHIYYILYPLLFAVGGFGFCLMNFAMAWFLAPRARPSPEKMVPYECGEYPMGSAWVQYNVRYYLYAMMFVLFDVEVVFLFPWAASFKSFFIDKAQGGFATAADPHLGLVAFLEMLLFLALLIGAIGYAWRKRVMEWF
jgi:NADH-quinone oxidoreductase subunit A